MPGEGLVIFIEFFHLRIRQVPGPPDACENVIRAVAHSLAGIGFRATRSVADHLVTHAALQILTVHGDVVLQVSVG